MKHGMKHTDVPGLLVAGGVVIAGVMTAVFFGSKGSGGTSPQIQGNPMPSQGRTNDWTSDDIDKSIAFGQALGLTDLSIPLRTWAYESDNKAWAHNPAGASGIFQLTPGTARGLGYDIDSDPDMSAFRQFSVSEQLDWALKFYGPHKGNLNSVTRFYASTFVPAFLSGADDPSFQIANSDGTVYGNQQVDPASKHGADSRATYSENASLDADKKGWIEMDDLRKASERATGPRTHELIDRQNARLGVA